MSFWSALLTELAHNKLSPLFKRSVRALVPATEKAEPAMVVYDSESFGGVVDARMSGDDEPTLSQLSYEQPEHLRTLDELKEKKQNLEYLLLMFVARSMTESEKVGEDTKDYVSQLLTPYISGPILSTYAKYALGFLREDNSIVMIEGLLEKLSSESGRKKFEPILQNLISKVCEHHDRLTLIALIKQFYWVCDEYNSTYNSCTEMLARLDEAEQNEEPSEQGWHLRVIGRMFSAALNAGLRGYLTYESIQTLFLADDSVSPVEEQLAQDFLRDVMLRLIILPDQPEDHRWFDEITCCYNDINVIRDIVLNSTELRKVNTDDFKSIERGALPDDMFDKLVQLVFRRELTPESSAKLDSRLASFLAVNLEYVADIKACLESMVKKGNEIAQARRHARSATEPVILAAPSLARDYAVHTRRTQSFSTSQNKPRRPEGPAAVVKDVVLTHHHPIPNVSSEGCGGEPEPAQPEKCGVAAVVEAEKSVAADTVGSEPLKADDGKQAIRMLYRIAHLAIMGNDPGADETAYRKFTHKNVNTVSNLRKEQAYFACNHAKKRTPHHGKAGRQRAIELLNVFSEGTSSKPSEKSFVDTLSAFVTIVSQSGAHSHSLSFYLVAAMKQLFQGDVTTKLDAEPSCFPWPKYKASSKRRGRVVSFLETFKASTADDDRGPEGEPLLGGKAGDQAASRFVAALKSSG